jgi:hypothetical protein
MLFLICSTLVLGKILHHNHVMLFSCFHNKFLFEAMLHISCSYPSFHVLYLDLKLGSPCHGWFVSLKNPLVFIVKYIFSLSPFQNKSMENVWGGGTCIFQNLQMLG